MFMENPILIGILIWLVETWLSSSGALLLLQRTRVLFQEPTRGSSQLFVTLAPRGKESNLTYLASAHMPPLK